MADNDAVLDGISKRDDVVYSVLTPNMKGFDAAPAHRDQFANYEVVILAQRVKLLAKKISTVASLRVSSVLPQWLTPPKRMVSKCAASSLAPWVARMKGYFTR